MPQISDVPNNQTLCFYNIATNSFLSRIIPPVFINKRFCNSLALLIYRLGFFILLPYLYVNFHHYGYLCSLEFFSISSKHATFFYCSFFFIIIRRQLPHFYVEITFRNIAPARPLLEKHDLQDDCKSWCKAGLSAFSEYCSWAFN